ncbi:MAG: hypothetical protein L0Y54_18955, partial [Sporichthyaceae bacterium]|nr:hypothetical protein [Sporichthyaceae bacterium]
MTEHLWFRLDEVLPLAEHAAVATHYQRTRAQALAGAADGPALTFISDHAGDHLQSNGLPGWHNQNGHPHQVTARRWRRYGQHPDGVYHPPSTACAGELAHGYLPLTNPDATHHDQPIQVLRRLASARGHWLRLGGQTGRTS